ncbi:MAG: GntR family transcriptional regulator [Kiritimatiellae bacterium]|nr:GntR family transcriptional regulator [Kiritimatiellia bacterium]
MKNKSLQEWFSAPERDPAGVLRVQIAAHIRVAIESGRVAPGSQLPPVRALAQAWQADPMTVQRALVALEQEGLLVRRHGKGTFVRERPRALKTIGLYYYGGALANPEFRYLRAIHRCLTDRIEASGRNWDVWNDPRPAAEAGQAWPALLDAVKRGAVDAVIAAQVDAAHALWLDKLPVPVAIMGSRRMRKSIPHNLARLPRMAVEALARQGCRSVGLISAWPSRCFEPDHTDTVLVCYKSFMQEARKRKLRTLESWLVTPAELRRTPAMSCEEWGYKAFMRVWNQPRRPDGLVVINDAEALGVTMAILEKSIQVPDTLRLAYHKNAEVNLFCPLPVTHVVNKADDAAAALLESVQQQYDGKKPVLEELTYVVEEPAHVAEAVRATRSRPATSA